MCKYFSCIVTRELKVVWSKKTCAHKELIAEAKLSDTKLENRDFVRVELPQKLISQQESKMIGHIGKMKKALFQNGMLKHCKIQKKVWAAWKESVLFQLLIGEEQERIDTYFLLLVLQRLSLGFFNGCRRFFKGCRLDSSKVVAWDSSTVDAWNSSKVVAWDSSKVVAWDSSTVDAWNSQRLTLGFFKG